MKTRKPLSPVEQSIRDAWQPKRISYRPDAAAFETATTQDFAARGYGDDGYSWPEHRDPILTPIFASLLGVGNFTIFGTVSLASTLSAVTLTATTPGVQVIP